MTFASAIVDDQGAVGTDTGGGGGGGGGTPPVITGGGGDAGGFYIAPSGDDTAGGTIDRPWATLRKFLTVAPPGARLNCRDGQFTGSGNRQLNLGDYGTTGSVGSPITIAAYTPSGGSPERPIFNGQANGSTDHGIYWINANGDFSHFVLDGLTLQNFAMIQDGIITLSNQTAGRTITDWVLRRMDIQQRAPADPSAQVIYLGERFSGFIAEDSILRGSYPGSGVTGGAGVSAFSDDGPAPTNVVVRRCIFDGLFTGVQFYSSGVTGSITHCTFKGCRDNIDATHHGTILVRDNAGTTGSDANFYDPDPTGTTADHNFWGQTLNPDYSLVGGSSGLGAASDGTNAGAVQ